MNKLITLLFFLLASQLVHSESISSEDLGDLPEKMFLMPWVKPSLYLTMVDELTLLDPADGLPEYSWVKQFLKLEAQNNEELKSNYLKFSQLLDGVDDLRRFNYIDTYYEETKEELIRLANHYYPWGASFKLGLQQDSNVTQSPDDQAVASQEEGLSYTSSLLVDYKFRKHNFRQFALAFGAGLTEYPDSQFETRETKNTGLKLSYEIEELPIKTIKSIKPEIRYNINWLNNGGSEEIGFETLSLGVHVVRQPWAEPFSFSDAIVALGILGVDFRDYKNFLESGSRGDKRDARVPSLTLVAVSLKQKDELKHKSTLLVHVNNSESDDPNQEYFYTRLSLQHQVEIEDYKIGPQLIYTYRNQDDYEAQSRRDHGYEAKLTGQYQWRPDVELGLSLGYKRQDSTQIDFDFDNTYVAIEGQWKFNFATNSPYFDF